MLMAHSAGGCLPGRSEGEHAGDVLRGVLAVESLPQQSEDPEHRHFDDLLG